MKCEGSLGYCTNGETYHILLYDGSVKHLCGTHAKPYLKQWLKEILFTAVRQPITRTIVKINKIR